MTIKISVVTIMLNPGAALTRTVESIVGQTYAHLEWIVVDGGSTDGSLDLLTSWRSRCAVLISERDEGIADAMNKGLRAASGDAIMYLHAGDEYIDEKAIEQVVDLWEANRYGWATGGGVFVSPSRQVLDTRNVTGLSMAGLLAYGCRIMHPSTVAWRRLYETYGGFDTRFRLAADYEFWLRLLANGQEPQLLPFPIGRFHVGGASAHVIKRFREDMRAREIHRLSNSLWVDIGLGLTAVAKAALSPLRNARSAYKVKERLRL